MAGNFNCHCLDDFCFAGHVVFGDSFVDCLDGDLWAHMDETESSNKVSLYSFNVSFMTSGILILAKAGYDCNKEFKEVK